ncbi:MAG TPA: AIR synthase-related protein, partial [Chloroflexia bacterium]|nr:AIR synthase-related protein [Chloroflexia bacterium]
IEREGGIDPAEMARVFNMGIGMVVVVAPEDADAVLARTPEMFRAGRVIEADTSGDRVVFAGRAR